MVLKVWKWFSRYVNGPQGVELVLKVSKRSSMCGNGSQSFEMFCFEMVGIISMRGWYGWVGMDGRVGMVCFG